jgi:hypothetical protein
MYVDCVEHLGMRFDGTSFLRIYKVVPGKFILRRKATLDLFKKVGK